MPDWFTLDHEKLYSSENTCLQIDYLMKALKYFYKCSMVINVEPDWKIAIYKNGHRSFPSISPHQIVENICSKYVQLNGIEWYTYNY